MPIHADGCELEQALVDFVPPMTGRILAVYRCGGLSCVRTWTDPHMGAGTFMVCQMEGPKTHWAPRP